MDQPALLAAIGLLAIATLAGGAAYHLVVLLGFPAGAATVALLGASVGAVLVVPARRRPRLWTPYW